MSEMSRRQAVALLAVSPLLTAQTQSAALVQIAARQATRESPVPRSELHFFTPHEFATVSALADLVIPADERSGSATQAGVPQFMDFMLYDFASDRPRLEMRGGLAWLDYESRRRFEKAFVELAPAQQANILDDIAWPGRARPAMSHGVAFFNLFRDLVVSGFWSSELGVQDIRFLGNRVVSEWQGCPPEALERLGVGYPE